MTFTPETPERAVERLARRFLEEEHGEWRSATRAEKRYCRYRARYVIRLVAPDLRKQGAEEGRRVDAPGVLRVIEEVRAKGAEEERERLLAGLTSTDALKAACRTLEASRAGYGRVWGSDVGDAFRAALVAIAREEREGKL